MKSCVALIFLFILGLSPVASATTYYVDLNSPNPTPPYTDWSTAATNIQDAIDVATNGDLVLVTNGVYSTGGITMAGLLTNRVTLNKALTVQSVNGAKVTTIQGSLSGSFPTRCAWLTNNASLLGFTLKFGRANAVDGEGISPQSNQGGGVWGSSSNSSVVANCIIASNTSVLGGGAYQVSLQNCLISSNSCANQGAGAYASTLNNCTVVSNESTMPGSVSVVQNVKATNCIIQFNNTGFLNQLGNNLILSYCCTTPLPPGQGNFTNDPGLFYDGVHLYQGSPCIYAGTNTTTGTDLFGETWANPPSIGCAEWEPQPIVAAPIITLTADPVGFGISVPVAGEPPFACWWTKDGVTLSDNGHFSGTQTTNLLAVWVNFSDQGNYQLFVSNAFGMVTSAVVASPIIHCVDQGNSNPVFPYLTWSTAATNIQDAITAADPGEIILVTNGVYASGGISVDGQITNRVSITKPILVQSVNGLTNTIIEGTLDPVNTNGPLAVRCAWLTNNSILGGFTLRNGATIHGISASGGSAGSGGGVAGPGTPASGLLPTNSEVCNCLIEGNYAYGSGGGVYFITLNHCTLLGNQVVGSATFGAGGGAESCILNKCFVISNSVTAGKGGGTDSCILKNCAVMCNSANLASAAYGGSITNCTISSNTALSFGGGTALYGARLTSCIVLGNFPGGSPNSNYQNCILNYCCTYPQASGFGNIAADPLWLVDGLHLSSNSPCIGAGKSGTASGTDIFGRPWNNPPSMGCAEFDPAPPIVAQPILEAFSTGQQVTFSVNPIGQPPLSYTWFANGMPIQDNGHYTNSSTASLSLLNLGLGDAGAYQVIVSNAYGATTSQVFQLSIHVVDANGTNAVTPFLTWDTAATNIQDAIDAATNGDIVLVTNGLYTTGGRSADGVITNRITVDKPLTVMSVHGFSQTTIQGFGARGVPLLSGNGPLAVRCVWLTNGATLSGFTLQNGATRSSGTPESQSGGGVYCSSNATVFNCVLSNNCAVNGGGIANGTLYNSRIGENTATNGGGAFSASLYNCDIEDNYSLHNKGGGGVYNCAANNCIIDGNYDQLAFQQKDNYPAQTTGNGTFAYCFTDPKPSFPNDLGSNILFTTAQPIYLGFFNMAATSPTRYAGNPAFARGTDLRGRPWANPPSVGCEEVIDADLIGPLSVAIQADTTNFLTKQAYGLVGLIAGEAATVNWNVEGSEFTNSVQWNAVGLWNNPGTYNVTFTAYNFDNPTGVSTNVSVTVIAGTPPTITGPPVVEAASPNSPLTISANATGTGPLFFIWTKNGTTIQNNGHYTNSSSPNLTFNTFSLSDAGNYQLTVSSFYYGSTTSQVVQLGIHAVDVNSTNPAPPYSAWDTAATTIQDAIDAASPGDIVLVTNGIYSTGGKSADGVISNRVTLDKPLSVISVNGYSATTIQGAWDPITTNGPLAVRCAWLTSGASLRGFTLEGGATRATGIQASQTGGGIFGAADSTVFNCVLTNNSSIFGGGIAYGTLKNSLVISNSAISGGGAYYATLNNCTLVNNYTDGSINGLGGGTFNCTAYNCIISGNFDTGSGSAIVDNHVSDGQSASLLAYCCTEPLPISGTNTISDIVDNPIFLDTFHIAATSPCRNAGSALYATGTDLDGEAWSAMPSIGCDQVIDANLTGPLSVAIEPSTTNTLVNREVDFLGAIEGRASRAAWNIDAGPVLTNAELTTAFTWTAPGTYTVTLTAFNVDNPAGVSTNISITVSPVLPPPLQSATVATNGLQFSFPTQPGGSYEIQFTTDLTPPVTWQTVQLIVGDGNTAQATLPTSGGPAGFYRIQAQ